MYVHNSTNTNIFIYLLYLNTKYLTAVSLSLSLPREEIIPNQICKFLIKLVDKFIGNQQHLQTSKRLQNAEAMYISSNLKGTRITKCTDSMQQYALSPVNNSQNIRNKMLHNAVLIPNDLTSQLFLSILSVRLFEVTKKQITGKNTSVIRKMITSRWYSM